MSSQPDPSILLVDPVSSGESYVPLLHREGVTFYMLETERALVSGMSKSRNSAALSYESDFGSDIGQLATWCEEHDVRYVITGSEPCVGLCDELRDRLAIVPRNNSRSRNCRWDKLAMSSALSIADVPALSTTRAQADAETSERVLGLLEQDGSVVVKPSIGCLSMDVRLVHDKDSLDAAIAKIMDGPGIFGDRPSALVQEVYPLPRTEYVVDTFSYGERHEIIAVSKYDKRVSEDGDFVYDRIVWVDPDSSDAVDVATYARHVLDALGVRVGASHLEIMHGADAGPRLVDYGGRAHGAKHPLKTYFLVGTSQIHRECEVAAATVRGRLSEVSPGTGRPALPSRGAVVFFNTNTTIECVRTPSLEELMTVEGVKEATINTERGSIHRPTKSLTDAISLGLAFVTAPTDEALDRRCAEVRRVFHESFEIVSET